MEICSSNSQFLSEIDTVIFDCDGVLWNAEARAIDGAPATVNKLRELGKKVFFITNNSSKTRKQYAERCQALGIEAREEEILCTAWLAAAYLADDLHYKGKVYVVGGDALEEEITAKGLSVTGPGEDPVETDNKKPYLDMELDPDVNAVVVGFDPHISYPKVVKAASYLQRPNCIYIGTNMDSFFPTDNNIRIPGTGSLVQFVSFAAEREPRVVGKPEPLFREILESHYDGLKPARTLMVGDRLNTDVKFGNESGYKTLLVLSGVHSLDDMRSYMSSNSTKDQLCVPNYYAESVGELLKYLQ